MNVRPTLPFHFLFPELVEYTICGTDRWMARNIATLRNLLTQMIQTKKDQLKDKSEDEQNDFV